jgi:hypothetical protein
VNMLQYGRSSGTIKSVQALQEAPREMRYARSPYPSLPLLIE